MEYSGINIYEIDIYDEFLLNNSTIDFNFDMIDNDDSESSTDKEMNDYNEFSENKSLEINIHDKYLLNDSMMNHDFMIDFNFDMIHNDDIESSTNYDDTLLSDEITKDDNESLENKIMLKLVSGFTQEEIEIIKLMHLSLNDASKISKYSIYKIKKISQNMNVYKWPYNYIHTFIESLSLDKYNKLNILCKYLVKKFYNELDYMFINMIFGYMMKYHNITDPKNILSLLI
jgi:hypothetical protein